MRKFKSSIYVGAIILTTLERCVQKTMLTSKMSYNVTEMLNKRTAFMKRFFVLTDKLLYNSASRSHNNGDRAAIDLGNLEEVPVIGDRTHNPRMDGGSTLPPEPHPPRNAAGIDIFRVSVTGSEDFKLLTVHLSMIVGQHLWHSLLASEFLKS